jgi:peptide deformylase
MILKIVDPGHPGLYKAVEEFDFANPPCDPVELANDLIETMTANKGLGLAANQCGLPYRAFVLWSEQPFVVFNPRIVDQTTENVLLEEGCLTFPHLFIKIKRPKIIKVRFQDAYGETHTEKFIGMTARGFLHEMDHLDGIIYQKRASIPQLNKATNQRKILERKLKRGEVYYKPVEVPSVVANDKEITFNTRGDSLTTN